ncbi:YiiD C-terminal domain-containing protein [Brevibacillus dissolubilis]|uniref:YiiD C-terminal domain-containing protein n=1 Tax=Brevibacillus dissolubilis TaxID=1844116 RepID=UPI001116BF64|nr:YiiD C-terminal domain-containing protein [Brevibacillus dissolubilis]
MKEIIQAFFQKNNPFSQTIGAEVIAAEKGAVQVRLPHREANHNHVKTIHAGAQFTLAESAAGAVMMATFPDLISVPNKVTLLVTHSSIDYKAPGIGDLDAFATIPADLEEEIRNTLKQPGDRIRFTVTATVKPVDGEEACAEAEFGWYFKLNE